MDQPKESEWREDITEYEQHRIAERKKDKIAPSHRAAFLGDCSDETI